jgi:hypothetical protein
VRRKFRDQVVNLLSLAACVTVAFIERVSNEAGSEM